MTKRRIMIPMLMDEEIWILTRQMKTSLPYKFLAAWMSVVCYLSPIYLFTDAHLLPKWSCLLHAARMMTIMRATCTHWRKWEQDWVGDGEDTSPAFSKIADMDSVLIDFKNMMGHTVNSTKVRLYILATNDMTQFGARAELNPRDGDFRTASVKLLDDDSLNYTFKVTINILDRYENKQKGIIELPCPKSSFF